MTELQYAHYTDLPRQQLGLMANQLYLEDPKMLGIHLARYKFVAKMLAGKKHVAEVGCGDGWYSKIVAKEVSKLDLFDIDNGLLHDAKQRGVANLHLHDIRQEKLSPSTWEPYHAIYSLDVMEHIHPKDEKTYLRNICDSLKPEGVFIVGMPSLESQKYASQASKIGHVNCQSGNELKHTLQEYFHQAFMFGMSDETIHTGFLPMCHYLIAVCVGVK